jgi:hypothetical protein
VVFRDKKGAVIQFQPQYVPRLHPLTLYSVQHGRVRELDIDPQEWEWKHIGHIKPTHFFGYTTKMGYKIITIRERRHPKFSTKLEALGFLPTQLKRFYKALWHKWIPEKIATMVWLTCQGGLPLAEWRMRLGHDGRCNLCQTGALETQEHTFMHCQSVQGVWEKVRTMRILGGWDPALGTWLQVLSGIDEQPGEAHRPAPHTWQAGQPTGERKNLSSHMG